MFKKKALLAFIFVVCSLLGLGLILTKPSWMGEEWIYREKSLNLLDRSTALLMKYSEINQEYLGGIIDQATLRNHMFDYFSCIKIIDGEAHGLSPLEGYENFHEHFMKGIHLTYDIMFYHLTNESDINAAMDEINYAKITMPNAKTPKPIDLSLLGKAITFIGVVGLIALTSQFRIVFLVNIILTLVFGMCNFLDWNSASALTCIPCDWSIYFIITPKAILPNFSFIMFLITIITSSCITYMTPLKKFGMQSFIFVDSIATVLFIFSNFFDFNSLLRIFLSSTGNIADYNWWFLVTFFVFRIPLSPSGLQYSWKGFVNLSMITFLATIGLNLGIWKRRCKRK